MCYSIKSMEHGALAVEHGDRIRGCATIKTMYVKGMRVERRSGLAACPLCGNEAVFVHYGGGVFVKCSCCECMVAKQISVATEDILPFKDEDDAIKVWNRRNGKTVEPRFMQDKATPGDILKARDARADRIAMAIKSRKGEYVTVKEIVEITGIRKSIICNTMHYIKTKYPNISARQGLAGYIWKE